jgi:hypothetical protein
MTQSFSSLYIGLDLAGTTAFALSGTLAGVERELDPFGVFVLAIATALGGGILRDVLIEAVPPGRDTELEVPDRDSRRNCSWLPLVSTRETMVSYRVGV